MLQPSLLSSQLREPLEHITLPHLPVQALGSLARTCKVLQQSVEGLATLCGMVLLREQAYCFLIPYQADLCAQACSR